MYNRLFAEWNYPFSYLKQDNITNLGLNVSFQAIAVNINPLYLMIPGNIACLYAFMLPVATPPNAIVFSYGHLKVFDMVRRFQLHSIYIYRLIRPQI